MRPTAKSILTSFQASNKKHLFLTGSRGSGKSTLLRELAFFLAPESQSLPGITTKAVPGQYVLLFENGCVPQRSAVIGRFQGVIDPPADRQRTDPSPVSGQQTILSPSGGQQMTLSSSDGRQMAPDITGFLSLGIPALARAAASCSPWVSIDELGYLENACPAFQRAVSEFLEQKSVLAVLRKPDTPFLCSLAKRPDVFLVDLDKFMPRDHTAFAPKIGCVIMASGNSSRFGSNKLLADFHGQPLIQSILDATSGGQTLYTHTTKTAAEYGDRLFAARIVVTRHMEIAELCGRQNIPVLLHDLPHRSDTIRLGLDALCGSMSCSISSFSETAQALAPAPPLDGCMFCPADQPLLRRESLAALCEAFGRDSQRICRLGTPEAPGNPVIFPARLFDCLRALPPGAGGSYLIRRLTQESTGTPPETVVYVPVQNERELLDADTPEALQKLL